MMAMKNDEEMNKLVAGTTISQGGVLPNVSAYLFGKSKSGRDAATMEWIHQLWSGDRYN